MARRVFYAFLTAALLAVQLWAAPGHAQVRPDDIRAAEIRVVGAQRIEAETVRTYITIKPGDPITPEAMDQSLKKLFGTGLFADVIVQANPHYGVLSSRVKMHKIYPGNHGWDPSFKDMHGIFLAAGPRLPMGETIGTIDNIDIYPLMMEILEIPLTAPIDGDPSTLTELLTPR